MEYKTVLDALASLMVMSTRSGGSSVFSNRQLVTTGKSLTLFCSSICAPPFGHKSQLAAPRGDPLHGPRSHPELRCDLVEAWPPRSRQSLTDSLFQVHGCARASEGFPALGAARLGPGKASPHPLDNHAALELGKHAHHLKHGLAGGRRGVDALLMQGKVDPDAVQVLRGSRLGLAASARGDPPTTP